MTVELSSRYGPWALITGAAQGLGAEFAHQLAARGLDLLLVDRDAAALEARVRALSARFAVRLQPVVVDLSAPDFMARLSPHVDPREIGLLVSSAALAPLGPFLDQPLPALVEVLQLNCRAPLVLCHELGRRMRARGRGALVLVSSMSGRQGTPLVAHYAATKAYNQLLAESLWLELAADGIDVLALTLGPTDTPGFRSSEPDLGSLPGRLVMACPESVSEALAGLGRRPHVVPGRLNRLASFAMERLLPRHLAIRLIARNMRALYPRR